MTYQSYQPKSQPPAITTTVLITFFFGIFGLIPAFRHRNKARALGRHDLSGKYFVAFWITFALSFALVALFRVSAGV